MKKLYLILLFLFFSICCHCQSYRLIEKAEKNIELRDYSKALKLLKKAESADYGFCGTAKMEALYLITELRFRIYKETNNPKDFETFLNSIDPFFEHSNIYSVERIKLAKLRFKSLDLNSSIIASMQKIKEDDKYEFGNIIPLKIDESYSLKLFFRTEDIWKLQSLEKLTYNQALVKVYENSEYYKLIKG